MVGYEARLFLQVLGVGNGEFRGKASIHPAIIGKKVAHSFFRLNGSYGAEGRMNGMVIIFST